MLKSVRNLKKSEIELRHPLPALESEWLVGRLLAKQGVETAEWVGNSRRLLVDYDADLCASAELSALLQHCGVTGAAVRVGSALGVADRTAHERTETRPVTTLAASRACVTSTQLQCGVDPCSRRHFAG